MKRPSSLRGAWNTTAALLILGFLLFPVYWMLNTALQPDTSITATEWFPTSLSLSNFDAAVSSQGKSLLTSLVVALGAVVVALALAAPRRTGWRSSACAAAGASSSPR